MWVHAQDALRLAGAVGAGGDGARAARCASDGVPEPADDWLLWILLLRALVDKGDAARAPPAAPCGGSRRPGAAGRPALVALARAHGIAPEPVVRAAAAGDWAGLLAHAVHRPAAPRRLPARLAAIAADLRRGRGGAGHHRRGPRPRRRGQDDAHRGARARACRCPTRIQYMGLTGGKLPRADALRVPGLVFAARVAILWSR